MIENVDNQDFTGKSESNNVIIEDDDKAGFYLFAQLNTRQKAFVNAYIANGGDSVKSYRIAYDPSPEMPDATIRTLTNSAREGKRVSDFLSWKFNKDFTKKDITKDGLIGLHLKIVKMFDKVADLLEKDELTEKEQKKLFNYQMFLKTADYKGALKEISSLQGFDIQKIEVEDKRQIIRILTSNSTSSSKILNENTDENNTSDFIEPIKPIDLIG